MKGHDECKKQGAIERRSLLHNKCYKERGYPVKLRVAVRISRTWVLVDLDFSLVNAYQKSEVPFLA
jgi:hypothetical protein